MDMLKSMKETLMCAAQSQMSHLDSVDAKELGEVIDMVKDLEEAIYYCTITEAMNKKEEHGNNNHTTIYYSEPMMKYPMDYNRMYYDGGTSYRMYNDGGRMYAGDSGSGSSNRMYADGGRSDRSGNEGRDGRSSNGNEGQDGRRGYSDMMMKDPREGNSPMQRRMYMESKQMHHGKAKQLQELEKYMKDLSGDLVEMIEDASLEEKQYLSNRLSALATKITKLEND